MLQNTRVQHIIFWILYIGFNTLRWGFFYDDFEYSISSNLVEFAIHIPLAYINVYLLLPRLFPNKISLYVIAIIILMALFTIFRILLTYQFVTTEVLPEFDVPGLGLSDPNYFIATFIGEFYVVGFTMAIKLGMDYITSIRKNKELEEEKMEAELAFLRSQIQPHFFFNTLNNLYSLTLHQSKKAPETILKLSDLMSYVIYKGRSNRVELIEEVKHINDYLDLEKLRYGDRLKADVSVFGSMEDQFIPPLILIPFIENCFKHGNVQDAEIPISVQLIIKGHQLDFRVENKISKEHETMETRKGVGIKNVKRRLNILFPNKYQLKLERVNNTFASNLVIPLYDKLSNN